jgi:uncharacterized protein (TIGR00251 family)
VPEVPGTLRLRVIPNARRDEVVGEYGDTVKIKIAAPALEGKANEAIRGFLAERLGVSVRAVEFVSGEKSRDKVVAVAGLNGGELRRRLLESVPGLRR